MKLSICVITMNRAAQLREALESCLACELPRETEFVIIDNASVDDTEQTVWAVLGDCGFPYYYEKMAENLGVGGGRNYAYNKACGEYVYVLDDDAVIDVSENLCFFRRGVEILDQNPEIASLTTQIYDTVWKENRVDISGPQIGEKLYKALMFCGGSHFLRKSFYGVTPYLPNKYGYEELPPSIRAYDGGRVNAFSSELLVIHKPAINKWDYSDEKNHALLAKGIALPYAIKKMMYPTVFLPVLKLAMAGRIKKYMAHVPNKDYLVKTSVKAFCTEYPIKERVKFLTVLRMFRDFKLSVF